MIKHYSAIFETPIGNMGLVTQGDKLLELNLVSQDLPLISPQDKFSKHIIKDVSRYFDNPNYSFTIDFEMIGSPFQQKAWRVMQKIPNGKVKTYGELAKTLKTAPRAVGVACRTNPVIILVPCHRIVGANNHLGGYSGQKHSTVTNVKKWLLQHEGLNFDISAQFMGLDYS